MKHLFSGKHVCKVLFKYLFLKAIREKKEGGQKGGKREDKLFHPLVYFPND